MSNEVSQNITVSRDALYQVLRALIGQPYLLGELRATRSLHKLGHPNPIETLIEQFNACAPTAQEAPTAVAGPSEFPHEQMDAMALARYKVVPSTSSMFWSHAVVAGDGAQQLYVGREVECQNMVRKFAGAFLDGAFAFHSIAADPTTPAAPVAQGDALTPGLIAAAEHIEGMASGYIKEHARTEPDTGAVVFDRRDAGLEYHSTLIELADNLRQIAARAAPTAQEAPKQEPYSGSTYAPDDSDIYELYTRRSRCANTPKEDGV